MSLFMTDPATFLSAADDSKTKDQIRVAGIPVTVENHQVPYVADPLQHRSRQTFVQMPPHHYCQVIQTPIDFQQPIMVIISLSTKVDK